MSKLRSNFSATKQPSAALNGREMLKEALIVRSDESGQTSAVRSQDSRDHNASDYSMWMASGGVEGGINCL